MLQEKRHRRRKNKKPSAMAQVHNKVNAGVMDGVVYGGGMMEGAEPEADEYLISAEGDNNDYFHVNETTDRISFFNLNLRDNDAIPFVTFKRVDGTDTRMFVGNNGESHSDMVMRLLSEKEITKDEFGSLWDITRNEYKSGRVWIKEDYCVISFYNYKDTEKGIYDQCVDALLKVRDATGADFNIGEVMVDMWQMSYSNPVFIPVRWFNSWVMLALSREIVSCKPIKSFSGEYVYELKTKKSGNFVLDWRGDDSDVIEPSRSLNESKNAMVDYGKYIKSFIEFLKERRMNVFPLPKIVLDNSEQDGIFVKTGYYSPDEKKVVVYINGRHPKDVLRTVAHEFVHHMQNLEDPNKDWSGGGDLEQDRKLRAIEGEAFLLGNILFREWTEKMKKTGELNESKKRKKQVKNDEGKLVPETCDKCGGKVVCQIHGEPVYVCKDCGKYFGTMPCNLNEAFDVKKALRNLKKRRDPDNIEKWDELNEITDEIVEPDDVDLSSFNIKKHLNPKFWDDGHLDTRIRLKLLDIADDFFASLGVDWVEPDDIIITGSIANYNWNKEHSDVDLHVLVDYEDVDERTDFVREYFAMKKNEWNEKHSKLRIYGFPVEVYVQDTNEPHASSGVYSVQDDRWLTEPDLEKLRSGKVDKKRVREMVSTYMNKIDALIDIYKEHKDDEYEMRKVYEDAVDMMKEIREMRKTDLAKYNREMCDGNVIFKALRRSDYIEKLAKLRDLAYDKINSL